jgi:NADPH-dependent glutamate synthase beta subunit-like oxidoreductase
VPVEGSEHTVDLNTLIVAIGEQMQAFELQGSGGVEVTRWGTIVVDDNTLATGRPGVFAGGDAVTGPNTVVDAIAAGNRAAVMMDRYVRGLPLRQPAKKRLPSTYVPPVAEEEGEVPRADCPTVPVEERRRGFVEVEQTLSAADATREARRCLRCDLEFTQPAEEEQEQPAKAVAQ